jgi:RNA polymerase sigma-70 factor (ECF subfamily)
MDDDERMERELLEAARDGQEHAGAFLVSLFGPRLMGYCRSVTRDMGDTDRDFIVEIAVETAVRKIDRYDQARGPLEAWLKTFVLHAAKDWRRSQARTLPSDPISPESSLNQSNNPRSDLSHNPDHDSDFLTSQRRTSAVEAVREALPRLSIDDQVMVAMRDLEGRPVREVATRLGINEDACRQRHRRAKLRLKKLLEADPRIATLTGDHT